MPFTLTNAQIVNAGNYTLAPIGTLSPESDRLLHAEGQQLILAPNNSKRLVTWSDGTMSYVLFTSKRPDADSLLAGYTRARERDGYYAANPQVRNGVPVGMTPPRLPGWADPIL